MELKQVDSKSADDTTKAPRSHKNLMTTKAPRVQKRRPCKRAKYTKALVVFFNNQCLYFLAYCCRPMDRSNIQRPDTDTHLHTYTLTQIHRYTHKHTHTHTNTNTHTHTKHKGCPIFTLRECPILANQMLIQTLTQTDRQTDWQTNSQSDTSAHVNT